LEQVFFCIFAPKLRDMKHLLTRRTIRNYTSQDVSEALLNRLLTEAARTQTMGILQLYSVVVTRQAEM
jgi:FMN reductase [NAD(P)H]